MSLYSINKYILYSLSLTQTTEKKNDDRDAFCVNNNIFVDANSKSNGRMHKK